MKKITTLLLASIATLTMSAQVVSDSVAHANGLWKENGVAYIDLGLPSGTCWAVHNFGSSKNRNPGYYISLGNDDKDGLDPTTIFVGKSWSIPTSKQWEELISNTEFYWNIIKDNPGVMLRSKINGRFLYLGAYGVQTKDEKVIGDSILFVYPGRDTDGDTNLKFYIGTKDGIGTSPFDNTYSLPIRAVIVKRNKDVAQK